MQNLTSALVCISIYAVQRDRIAVLGIFAKELFMEVLIKHDFSIFVYLYCVK